MTWFYKHYIFISHRLHRFNNTIFRQAKRCRICENPIERFLAQQESSSKKKGTKKSVLFVPSVGDKTSEGNKSSKKKYARKNLSTLWHKIHLPSQRRYHQMPMRLGATNTRSAPIYRRELHRLPLCELSSRNTKQQTLAKFLSKQKSTDKSGWRL
jgi:hypothetical protein